MGIAHRIRCSLSPFLVLGIVLMPRLASAAEPPPWLPAIWRDAPVRVVVDSRRDLEEMIAKVPVASFDRSQIRPLRTPGGERWAWEPRVTPVEEAALRAAGYAVERLPDRERAGREAVEQAWAARARQDAATGHADETAGAAVPRVRGLDYYPTHAEIGQLLAAAAAKHPTIARTVSWGTSVQGRELWGIVISDDVANTEPEPEVRLTAAIHGNEPPGMILLLNLVDHLTANYGQPGFEDVTALVDDREIHILPLHNPDGYAVGSRYNAHGVDLNRNYPDPAGTHLTREPETQHYMTYGAAHDFVVSQNGHAGALVVNYPWDYTYTRAPDDAALIQLSLAYSSLNPPMYGGAFPQGITNGADWYVARGTAQDWSYAVTGCIDLTIEVSNDYWPAAATLPGLWDDNRASLLALIRAAGYGLRGIVTDAATGAPLAATVTVAGIATPVTTDAEHGDFVKLLPSGVWEVTVSAPDHVPATFASVATTWGETTRLDVALSPVVSGALPPAPAAVALSVQPNPFNPRTTLRMTVPTAGAARLKVYDLRGRFVRTLVDAAVPAGDLVADWDGRDVRGAALPSGVYVARLECPGGSASAKLTLLE